MRRVGSALCVLMMIGCSRAPDSSSSLPPMAMRSTATSSNFKTIFIFQKNANGIIPAGSVIGISGTLYGATNFGGTDSNDCFPGHGCGTVYSIAVSQPGKEQILYKFKGYKNGARPYAGLVDVKGTLYGTTQIGGKRNHGTVYSITTSGSQHVLHVFDDKDGADPRASLINVNGVLYGTTYYGGSAGTGTVFSVTISGTEKVLHGFTGGADGALPLDSLVDINGVLYGTTSSGGANDDGTVFAISPGGSNYSVLYSFAGGADGADPYGDLAALNGVLYGTTGEGGKQNKGTVFSITPSGSETVLHSFGSGKDGATPYAGLTVLKGQLYGTTAYGGAQNEGTIYTITPSGSETVLHSFARGPGGRVPYAALTVMKGVLYGTTVWGGRGGAGVGTVFEFTP